MSAGRPASRRIAIIGNGGGGKTTLARQLGTALDLRVHHVSRIQFQPGWEYTPQTECAARLDAHIEVIHVRSLRDWNQLAQRYQL